MSAVNALPFSPLTRRGLSELSEETTKELAGLARIADTARDYFFEGWGDELGIQSRLWSDILAARSQRQTRRESAPHGDDMDGHYTDPERMW